MKNSNSNLICLLSFSVLLLHLNHVHDIIPLEYVGLFCAVNSGLVLSGTTCSAYLITFMTFERFYSIIQPHKAASFNTVKRAKITILCVIMFAVTFKSPYFFVAGNNGRYCILKKHIAQSVAGKIFFWVNFSVSFGIPFVLLIIMNAFIIRTLQKRSHWIYSHSDHQGQIQGQRFKHTDRQIYMTLVLVTFGFLILTTPFYAVQLWVNLDSGSSPYYFALFHLVFNIGEKLYYTNNGINFFLYVMSGNKFRSDLLKLLNCCKNYTTVVSSATDSKTTATSISES